jgi:hypothetical protein
MVLVRKTELACRNGWDDDLWEPRDELSTSSGGNRTAGMGPARRSGQRESERRDATRGYPDSLAEPVAGDSHPNGRIAAKHLAPAVDPESSTGLERGGHADPTRDAWSSSFEASIGAQRTDVDEFQGESVSRRAITGGPRWQNQLSEIEKHPDPEPDAVPRPPVFQDDVRHEEHNGNRPDDSGTLKAGERRDDERPVVQQSGQTEPFDLEAETEAPGDVFGVADVDQSDAEIDTSERASDYSDADNSRALPMAAGQANACCRNCRDFLPSEGSWRGWCNNPYAFAKRREVPGDSVACQSTFGNWWSPSDDWWLERADIAHHSSPTPLVDTMIRQIRDRDLEERGSTEGRDRS